MLRYLQTVPKSFLTISLIKNYKPIEKKNSKIRVPTLHAVNIIVKTKLAYAYQFYFHRISNHCIANTIRIV